MISFYIQSPQKEAIPPLPDRDRFYWCRTCRAYVGLVRDNRVIYFWDGITGQPEHALHAVDPVKLKCGGCNNSVRWRPLPEAPRGKLKPDIVDTGGDHR